MNSETKTTLKNRVLAFILGILIATNFLAAVLPNYAKAAVLNPPPPTPCLDVCTAPTPDSVTDSATITNFPTTVTLGTPFTFNVNLTMTYQGLMNETLANWTNLTVVICQNVGTACDQNQIGTQTLAPFDIPLHLTGTGPAAVPVTTAFTTGLTWAQPGATVNLRIELNLSGNDTQGVAIQDVAGDNANGANPNLVMRLSTAIANVDPLAPKNVLVQAQDKSTTSTPDILIQASIGGVVNPPGTSWTWQLQADGGAFVTLTQFSAPTSSAIFDLTSPSITFDHNYVLRALAVDTTNNITFPAFDLPLPVLTQAINPNNPNTTGTGANTASSADSVDITKNCSISNFLTCMVEAVVNFVVNMIKGFFMVIFALIIAPVMQSVLAIQPHSTAFTAVIFDVWVVIRNLMNIIFILALIVMAVATMLRIGDKYNYKHLLIEVILFALLINFSLVICQGILSVADTFQAQFLPQNADVVGRLAGVLIGNAFDSANSNLWQISGTISGVISSLFSLFFSFASLLAMGAVTIYLVIRIVMLWLLMMSSPAAYAFMVTPKTHHIAAEWWDLFMKYAFFTPLMALGLNVCALIVEAQRSYLQNDVAGQAFPVSSTTTLSNLGVNIAGAADMPGFIVNILTNALIIACLFATLEVAKEMNIFGAKTINGWVENKLHGVAHRAGHIAMTPVHRAGEGVAGWRDKMSANLNVRAGGLSGAMQRGLFRTLNPGKYGAAKAEERHHLGEARADVVKGMAAQMAERKLSHGALDNQADREAQRKQESSAASKFSNMNYDQKADQAKKIAEMHGHTTDKAGFFKDLMASGTFKPIVGGEIKRLSDEGLLVGGDGTGRFNDKNIAAYMNQVMGDDLQAKRFLATDFSKMAGDSGLTEATNIWIADKNGNFVPGDEPVPVNDSEVKMGMAEGTTITRQQRAMLGSIAALDPEKRGSVKLNLQNYFDDSNQLEAPYQAMANLVFEGGVEAAKSMSSNQRKAIWGTDKIDMSTASFVFEDDKDASGNITISAETKAQRFKNMISVDGKTIRPQSKDIAVASWSIANGESNVNNIDQSGVSIVYKKADGTPKMEIISEDSGQSIKAGKGAAAVEVITQADVKKVEDGTTKIRVVPQGRRSDVAISFKQHISSQGKVKEKQAEVPLNKGETLSPGGIILGSGAMDDE